MDMNKYYNYEYDKISKKMLDETKLTISDKIQIGNLKNQLSDKVYYYIVGDLYKLYVINKINTPSIANIYGVGVRDVQLWIKDLQFTRNKDVTCLNIEISNKNNKEYLQKYLDKYNYCLYRFLDTNRKVLYIGKCEKSRHSNGHGGEKEYFVKDRLTQHYSPSSKQNPKSLYLNTKYIEVCFPTVNNNIELERVESQTISYYERIKFECFYNKDLLSGTEYIDNDYLDWKYYEEKSTRDIEILLKKYKIEEIPPIEITNERLKAIMWTINKLN